MLYQLINFIVVTIVLIIASSANCESIQSGFYLLNYKV